MIFRWNEYREKDMVEVLDAEAVEQIFYTKLPLEDEEVYFNHSIDNPAAIQEFTDFLGQYKVKKIGVRDFSSSYPDEQFSFDLVYTDERNTIPSLIERNILLNEHDQYEITNGPVDYQWLQEFLEKHE
ncbi:hypothetical protein H1Q58_03210 [Planococcus maritimus]|uniref:Uncharacterized protein n=1 Tax=Planococcus maritimus TaxID=192421 RepID=A0A7D7RIA9_PLAMR|nr:hypothetical protein [Planococcus maritimus]QMT18043.1 hypothetical protein H1Q58_03210 [Planococcus maritimus]